MLAAVLTDAGFPARRGQQFHGGTDSPDIICPLLNVWHWESKLVETARIRDWLAQVEADSAGKPWVIAWKRRHGPWLAVVKLDALLDVIRETLPPATNLAPPPTSCDVETAMGPTPQNHCNEPKEPT